MLMVVASPPPEEPPPHPGRFDIILCRNVLLYFTPEVRRLAFARLADACQTDGTLMLGAGETVIGQSKKLGADVNARGLYRLTGDGRDLAGVVALDPADRDQGVAALGERVGDEVLELARLVAAVCEPGVAVLALRPDVDAAAEVLREPLETVKRRRPEQQRRVACGDRGQSGPVRIPEMVLLLRTNWLLG